MRPLKTHAGKAIFKIVVAVAVAAVIAVVALLALSGKSRLEPFPTAAYLEQPKNFLGNVYTIDAQVDSVLNFRPGVGRLLVVKSDGQPLPVFLPEGLISTVTSGQRYYMDVSIGAGGLIYVNELEKY